MISLSEIRDFPILAGHLSPDCPWWGAAPQLGRTSGGARHAVSVPNESPVATYMYPLFRQRVTELMTLGQWSRLMRF